MGKTSTDTQAGQPHTETEPALSRAAPMRQTKDPKTTDWERVEAEYRVGVMSSREIGAAHGVTEGAIRKRAKRDSWDRDLSAKVRIKAEALVRKEQVRAQVRKESPTERETVDAVAQDVARVRISHRKDIALSRSLCMTLLVELQAQTGNMPGMVELGEMLKSPGETGADKLNDIYRAVISLPERSKTMKALAESLKGMVGLEREAYGMDKDLGDGAANALAELLGGMRRSALPVVYQAGSDGDAG